jgi:uncharacterized protein YecE (DUF72 family)
MSRSIHAAQGKSLPCNHHLHQFLLDALSAQVASLAPRARVWCVFDNTASGAAIHNALALTAKLRQEVGSVKPAAALQQSPR